MPYLRTGWWEKDSTHSAYYKITDKIRLPVYIASFHFKLLLIGARELSQINNCEN